jgi:hypothetical protein
MEIHSAKRMKVFLLVTRVHPFISPLCLLFFQKEKNNHRPPIEGHPVHDDNDVDDDDGIKDKSANGHLT